MEEILLEVKDLKVWFSKRKNIKNIFSKREYIKAVDGISFKIKKGEVFGIVGESGCGKTTTAKTLMKLYKPTFGEILFENKNIKDIDNKNINEYKKNVQMIFQDPYSAMNPGFKIEKIIEEPLLIHKLYKNVDERKQAIKKSLEKVKLLPSEEYMKRYPHMLSGGQRQRAVTARALMLSPKLLIADEPVSMIDLSTKAEILKMFKDLKNELGLTYIYITHDLSTARYFTDRIAVMYLGKIVEIGTPENIIDNPYHPYTKALIAAVCDPSPKDTSKLKELPIKGEISSFESIKKGCRFKNRCIYAMDKCAEEEPELKKIKNEHYAACLL